jgi:hypothetical protein
MLHYYKCIKIMLIHEDEDLCETGSDTLVTRKCFGLTQLENQYRTDQ